MPYQPGSITRACDQLNTHGIARRSSIRCEDVRAEGRDGQRLYPALAAADKLNATVVNMRWVKPLDVELLLEVAASHEALVTLEEGAIMGGAGGAVGEALQAAGVLRPILHLGLPDVFIEHGDPAKLLALQGLDAAGIEQSIIKRFGDQIDAPRPALKVVG